MQTGFLEIDVHGMTREQAFTAIDAKLRRANASAYRLRVIHGYHGGTVLRDAIRAHYRNHEQQQNSQPKYGWLFFSGSFSEGHGQETQKAFLIIRSGVIGRVSVSVIEEQL